MKRDREESEGSGKITLADFCFPVLPQHHVRARRASFAVTICAAFLTAGSVTMTTTVRTTRMKGIVVSGGSLLACLFVSNSGTHKQRCEKTTCFEARRGQTGPPSNVRTLISLLALVEVLWL